MQILYHEKPVPYITINNYYNNEELSLIWQELNFLTHQTKLESPYKTGLTDQQSTAKRNHGVFLDSIYSRRELSNILTLSRKIYNFDLINYACSQHIIFNYLKFSKRDGTLLSYYEDTGQYLPHTDQSILTTVTWLYKEPKKFDGGDFFFSDYGYQIPIQNNMIILFPSFVEHSVSEIKMDRFSKPFSGEGRYSITNFITPF